MGSSDQVEVVTIHVRLLDELIPVWRPVKAEALGNECFVILAQEVPEFEEWEFTPGETVTVEAYVDRTGNYLKAIARS
ncbi:MAG: hypothetical protein EON58_17670 [Alphaproteobacteria bacterium]|nr:MAG: hypothetical protein EON58_17670 [Alphaproteobacteria bacterium]